MPQPTARDLPAAAEGLGPTDVQRIRQSLDHSVAETTRASSRSAWKTFVQWAGSRGALAMPARYTERQAADRGAVARYYQEQHG